MNFQDLMNRIRAIDEDVAPQDPGADPNLDPTNTVSTDPDDTPVEECGTDGEQPAGMAANDTLLIGEKGMEECGMPGMANMPSGMMGTPKQSDSVTMNVSMNGSGAGGIRDLMSILKNIEQGGHSHDMPGEADAVLVGVGEEQGAGFGQATTEPNTHTYDVDTMTGMGNDIHSKGQEFAKVNGGGNAMTVSETLVNRLTNMYQEIKSR
jgi:hypothetical protein